MITSLRLFDCLWFLLTISLSITVSAQKQAAHWVFGGIGGLDFSCSPPRLEISAFDGLEGAASISDKDGNLLMYTNGDVIWGRDHQIMPNGRGIGGLCSGFGSYASASQSSLIIPHPGNNTLYYVITSDCAEDKYMEGIQYSLVDITLNNGMGDVTTKNAVLLAPAAEKIAGIFHRNGHDVWVVLHGVNNNNFYSYLITDQGINETPVISTVGQIHRGGRGYLKFSPDGKRLATGSFIEQNDDGEELELFKFNDELGSVTADFILPGLTRSTYGLSFSPDGSKLYASCSWTCAGRIEQFDLNEKTPELILKSRYTFDSGSADERYYNSSYQLGLDGKLYFAAVLWNGPHIGVIDRPNERGAAAGFKNDLIQLTACQGVSWGFSNFIESYFKTPVPAWSTECTSDLNRYWTDVSFEVIPTDDCKKFVFRNTSAFNLEMADNFPSLFAPEWYFDFGDGTSAGGRYLEPLIEHEFPDGGEYHVSLSATFRCSQGHDTGTVSIAGSDISFAYQQSCDDLTLSFMNTSEDKEVVSAWVWNFGTHDNKIATSVDAQNTYDTPGTYVVTLSATLDDNGCSFNESQTVDVYDPITFTFEEDLVTCPGSPVTVSVPVFPEATYHWSDGLAGPEREFLEAGSVTLEIARGDCS